DLEAPEETGLTDAQIGAKIDRLIKSPDGNLALKAIELRQKREAAAQDRPTPEQTIEEISQVLIRLARPEMAPVIWGELVLRGFHWQSPWIKDFSPYLRQHHPDLWSFYRRMLAGEYGQMEDDVKRLEERPALPLQEILTRAGVGMPTAAERSNNEPEEATQ